MPELFLSHSSSDKDVVRQTAFLLADQLQQYWLDESNLRVGSLLDERIRAAIDRSDFFVLFLSDNALSSQWVTREIDYALEREKNLGRDFILPLKLSRLRDPGDWESRIYLDASTGHMNAINELVRYVKSVDLPDANAKKYSIPIHMSNFIEVDQFLTMSFVERIEKSFKSFDEFRCGNVVFDPRFPTSSLLEKLRDAEQHEDDGTAKAARSISERIFVIEDAIERGVVEFFQNHDPAWLADFLKWFVLLARERMIGFVGNYKRLSELEYPLQLYSNPLMGRDNVSKVYGDVFHRKVDVWNPNENVSFGIYCPDEVAEAEHLYPGVPVEAEILYGTTLFQKYLLPQFMAMKWVYRKKQLSDILSLDGFLVGPG